MVPIFKPYMPKGIISEIKEILYSGNLAFGRHGKSFEEAICRHLDNDKVITVSSYNHAMLIVLSALGLKPEDEVIASPVSCLASNQPFVTKNLRVIWADVNPLTGSLCPEDVRKKITSKTKAIFHNHFCGFVGDVDAINSIATEYGLFVVDDCIEAYGAEYKGKKMGGPFSQVSVFSFQTVRLPNTIDGAAITFRDNDLFEKAKKIRDYGIDRARFRDTFGEISANCDIEVEGYGALINEVNSYIGLSQMGDIDSLLKKQRQNALSWDEKISNSEGLQPIHINRNVKPNFWVYGVLCENKGRALEHFRKQGWYATGVHINNNIYSVFRSKGELNGVNDFMNKYLALPCGWWV